MSRKCEGRVILRAAPASTAAHRQPAAPPTFLVRRTGDPRADLTSADPIVPLRHPSQKCVVAVIYVCGMVMSSLDSTIVNVALATLSREFKVPPT